MASDDFQDGGTPEGAGVEPADAAAGDTKLRDASPRDSSQRDASQRDSSQRDAILRRRMFFVSSALTVLTGCPPGSPPPDAGSAQPSTTVVASVPHTDSGMPSPSGSSQVEPAPTTKLPPLTVPSDVNDTAKSHFQRLAELVPQIHAELDGAAKLVRSACDVSDPACDGAWSELASHLAKARDTEGDLSPRCGGSSEDAKRFEASLAAHQQAIDKRIKEIQAQIDSALDNDAKRARWEQHKAKAAVPRPCLKYSCEDW